MGSQGLKQPKIAQEGGYDVRIFMPKFGVINERRNQLHEVIRLSGLNISVAGEDHPLIIKVASLQSLRIQVYFIDNEEYFQRRGILHDELGETYPDNDRRALFFARGVLETVKKLRWLPDVIHCSGWFSSFLPMLIRVHHANDPSIGRSKILYTLYQDAPEETVSDEPADLLKGLRVGEGDKEDLLESTHGSFSRMAIRYADAVAIGENGVDSSLIDYAKQLGKEPYDLRLNEDLNEIYHAIHVKKFAL